MQQTTKRYSVQVTEEQRLLAMKIARAIGATTGVGVTYTTVLRHALQRGLEQLATEKNVDYTT